MNHKLIVHVGMPKTGTSAIQNFLFANREKLKEYGYYYPDLISEMQNEGYRVECRPEGLGKNGVVLGHFRNWNNLNSINPISIEEWKLFREKIEYYLNDYDVIISDEDLWCQGNNCAILRALKEISPDMKIVAYIRRQDLEVEALWNQVVKRYGYCVLPFPQAKKRWENDRALKYIEALDSFCDIVEMESLRVRVYEKQQLAGGTGNVIQDFLLLLGIDKNQDVWIEGASENDRLNGSMLNIKLAMNHCLSKENWFSGNIEEYFLSAVSMLQTENNKEAYYSYSERLEVLERFSEENSIIARKYLGRADGVLFLEEIKDTPVHVDNININDVIKVFTYMLLEQEKNIHNINSNLGNCSIQSIKKEICNRKLTLFGAGLICKKFLSVCDLDVDVIVDNDISKRGTKLFGIPVCHTSDVGDWKERYVVITCGSHRDIENQLKELGLKEYNDYVLGWELY